MTEAFICDAIRTPIGRYGGALSAVRTDDLAAMPLKALMARNPRRGSRGGRRRASSAAPTRPARTTATSRAWRRCWPGCRVSVPGATINRLCGSGMDAVGTAARAIKAGEAALMIAGGVESMSRAPFVMPKADSAFARDAAIYDTTIGWRFVNPLMKAQYGVDSMPETAENVAADCKISRADQDRFALRQPAEGRGGAGRGHSAAGDLPGDAAAEEGRRRRRRARRASARHQLEALAKLKPFVRADGTVTAGNASRRQRRRLRAAAGQRGGCPAASA